MATSAGLSGSNTVTGTLSADNLNGGAGADYINGMAGDDRINAGSGNDTIDGGAGSDIIKGDAGDDLAIYVAAENRTGTTSFTDIYDGGSGKDTVRLVLTRAEWMNTALQLDIANYLAFLAKNTNSTNGEANNTEFRFTAFDLRVSKFEMLQVMVDGVLVDPRDQAVRLEADVVRIDEDSASSAVDVLTNDSVPDLIKSLTHTQPAHGTVQLVLNLADPAAPASATFVYTPHPTHWQYLAAGETATDTFTYTVTDADGDEQTQTVTVTIEGRNDAPVIIAVEADSAGAVIEASSTALLSDAGSITFEDLDLSNTHTVDVGVAQVSTSAAVPAGFVPATGFGTLSAVVVEDPADLNNRGRIDWSYSVNDAAVQGLAAGETVTQTYTLTLTDSSGAPVTQNVTIVLTGTNDGPTIVTGDFAGAVAEDATTPSLTDAGSITFEDLDLSNTHTVDVGAAQVSTSSAVPAGFVPVAGFGMLTASVVETATDLDNKGRVDWSFDVDNAAVQGLAAGETVTQTYTLTLTDSSGALVTENVTITLTGTNDGPTIVTGAFAGAVTEDATTPSLTDAGSITFEDLDLSNTHTVSVGAAQVSTSATVPAGFVPAAGFGTLTASVVETKTDLDKKGQIEWSFNVDNAAVQGLAAGETVTQTYTLTLTDSSGAPVTKEVTIVLTGTNDAPVISSGDSANVSEIAQNTNGIIADPVEASGSLSFTDVDLSNTHSVSQTLSPPVWSGGSTIPVATAAALADAFSATLADVSTGDGAGLISWDFSLGNPLLDFLAAGETLTLTYNVTVTDNNGGADTKSVTVTITGANDFPIVDAVTGDISYWELTEADSGLSKSGTLTVTDRDPTDVVTASADGVDVVRGSTNGLTPAQLQGFFSVAPATLAADTGAAHNLTWSFNSGFEAFDYLAAGETLELKYWVKAQDDSGEGNDTGLGTVTIKITGTNDAPVIGSAQVSGSAAELADNAAGENSTPLSTTGEIAFTDLDLSNTHSVSATLLSATDSAFGATAARGTLTPVISDVAKGDGAGAITWTFDVNSGALDDLAAGQTLTQVYRVTVTDSSGATDFRDVTVTLAGTNDAPTIVAGSTTATCSVTEIADGTAGENTTSRTAEGTIAFADVDTIDAHSASVTEQDSGYLGSLSLGTVDQAGNSVNWTFSVEDSALDFLSAGEARIQNYTVAVSDGKGGSVNQTVSVTITGTNDAPVVSGAVTGTAKEDGALSTLSALASASDVDAGTTLSVVNVPGGLPAGVSYDAATQSFTLNPSVSAYQSLAAGEIKTVSVSYGVSDGIATTPASVSWTVTGTNDAPVAELDFDIIDEDDASRIGNVRTNDTDIDAGDILQVTSVRVDPSSGVVRSAAAGTTLQGQLGTLTIQADGSYVYELDNSDPFIQGLTADASTAEQFLYTVRDSAGALTEGRLTISIRGQNDAPVVSGAVTGTAVEDGTSSPLAALAHASDVDRGTKLAVVEVPTDLPAGVSYDTATQSFTLDPSVTAYQSLAAGQTTIVAVNYGVWDGIATTAASASWTVTGTNDAPTIVAASTTATGAVTERADKSPTENTLPDHTADGTISFADVDTIDTHSATVTPQGSGYLGSFSLGSVDQAGNSVGWTFSVADSALDSLAAGEARVQNYTVTLSDGKGGAVNQVVTVTLTGSNDAPVITNAVVQTVEFDATGTRGGNLYQEDGLSFSSPQGHIHYEDADHDGQAEVWGHWGGTDQVYIERAAGGKFSLVETDTFYAGWGTAVFEAWSYNSSNQLVQVGQVTATAGQHVTFGPIFQNVDRVVLNTGASSGQLGLDNLKFSTGDQIQSYSVNEIADSGTGENSTTHSASGAVTFSDVDTLDIHASSFAPASSGYLGTFSLGIVDQLSDKVNWTFTVADSALDSLAAGETRTQNYTVAVADGQGGIANQTATITLTGANDTPTIVAASTTATGSATERADKSAAENTLPDHTAGGAISFADVDTIDTHSATVTPQGSGYLGTLILAPVNQAGNSVGWTFSVADSALDSLAAGQTKTQSYTVAVADGKGGIANQTVAVTLTGANDAAVIGGVAVGAVTEDGVTTVGGALTIADVDTGEGFFAAVANSALHGTYGDFTFNGGAWTYSLRNGDANVQALVTGQTVYDTLTVTSRDGSASQEIKVSVAGQLEPAPSGRLLVDFEDITSSGVPISDGYKGFNWKVPGNNVHVLNEGGYIGTGYDRGSIEPGDNVSYDPFASNPVTISRSNLSDFVFDQVYLTAAWSNQSATITGYNNGNIVGTTTVAINTQAPTLVDVGWGAIDQLQISHTSDHIVMDNFLFYI
ncbi:VCBS domain-containing protein [Methylobacterium oxalidis]|uniref:VCBS domain-containing protein n=1 Tax=Methylobacterium oxalidis TaxID=944322 RepID=UPI0033160D4C